MQPAKTQISLHIRTVWAESLLSTLKIFGSWVTHRAHSKDWSDWVDTQAGLSSLGCTSHFLGFVLARLISFGFHTQQFYFPSGFSLVESYTRINSAWKTNKQNNNIITSERIVRLRNIKIILAYRIRKSEVLAWDRNSYRTYSMRHQI